MTFVVLFVAFLTATVFCLYLGLSIQFTKRPIVLSAKYNFWVVFVLFVGQLVLPFGSLFRYWRDVQSMSSKTPSFDWFMVAAPIFLVLFYTVLMICLWKILQGYQVFGVTEDGFRGSLENVLRKLSIPFEERLSKMQLREPKADLTTFVNVWLGVASIRIKDKDHKALERKIVDTLKEELKDNSTTVNRTGGHFLLILGTLLLVFLGAFTVWAWTSGAFSRDF